MIDFKIALVFLKEYTKEVLEGFDKYWIELAIGLTLFGSIAYNINDDSLQASIYIVSSIILTALHSVRGEYRKETKKIIDYIDSVEETKGCMGI